MPFKDAEAGSGFGVPDAERVVRGRGNDADATRVKPCGRLWEESAA